MNLWLSVEERLQQLVPSHLQRVESALDLAAVLNRPPQTGITAWVVPLGERAEGNARMVGPALQKVSITLGVVLAVRSINDPRGSRGSAALDLARHAVRQQLFGWQPQDALLPCLMTSSDLIRMEQATLWWMDRYTTAVQYRALQP